MRIYRRGQIWHYAGTVAGQRLRGSTRTTDKERAQRIAAEVESKAWRRHLDGPAATLTFAEAVTAYLEAGKPPRFVLRLLDYWKETPVAQITPGAVRRSAQVLYPHASGATRNRQVIVPTQAIVNHAAELEWCPRLSVRRFPVQTQRKEPATPAWVGAFAAQAMRDGLPHLAALAYFMLGTGARIGEATALRWRDVDLSRRRAVIRQTKVDDTRTAHLPPPVVAALANLPGLRHPGEPVFRYAERGSVSAVWRHVAARAGIEPLTPHCCRHGFATAMLRAGHDVATVAKLGGWKDVATVVRTYAHALDDETATDAVFATLLPQETFGRKEKRR